MHRLLLLIVCISLIIASCSQKDKYSVDRYFSESERDTLLTDIITYIYIRPPFSTTETRFEGKFRKYYVANLGKFRFENYYQSENGLHYFYLIRPARSVQSNIRGVGGVFKLDEQNNIIMFKEIFNTPPADLNQLRERGYRLFKEMIQKGNVDAYLHHPDFIEWPDERTYYDTLKHEWLAAPGK
jgi:hypothetical protein